MATITVYREKQFYVVDDGSKTSFIPEDRISFVVDTPTTLAVYISPFHTSTITWNGLASEIVNKNGASYGTDSLDVIDALNVGVDVNIQDQITPPLDTYFLQSISNFSLLSDTIASTATVLEYNFTAVAAHGIAIGNEIILIDVADDREFYGTVINVVGDVITMDRPLDHAYASATTLGRIVTSEMAVEGSLATPQIYTVRGGTEPADVVRMLITMLDGSSMDDGKFGGITALTNGLVFRVVDGYQKTIFNFKTNQDLRQFCYDVNYASKAAAGSYGLSSRLTFGGQHTHGVVLRVDNTSIIQWVVQDDLTGLDSLKIAAQGSQTTGEL